MERLNVTGLCGRSYSDFITQELPSLARLSAKYVCGDEEAEDYVDEDEVEELFQEIWGKLRKLIKELKRTPPHRWTNHYFYCQCYKDRLRDQEKREYEAKKRRNSLKNNK